MAKTWVCLLALAACTGGDQSDSDVQPTPVAVDDHVMIAEDQPLKLLDLAANDTAVRDIRVVGKPLHGTYSDSQYVPQPGYFGTDTLTYEGRYDKYSSSYVSTATVTIEITSDGIPYEQSQSLATTGADDLATGDLDGDGNVDIVTCNSRQNELTVLRNTTAAGGAYSVEEHVFEGGGSPVGVVIGDIDGDGRADIVTAGSGGLALFRNLTQLHGPLAFAGPVSLGSVVTKDVVLTDVDGDGKLDLAAIEPGRYYSYDDGILHVWINASSPGGFSFGLDTKFATAVRPTQIVAVDADANGKTDLAVLGDQELSLFVNATAVGAAVAAFNARVDRATGPSPRSMFLADLDGDGQPEIGVSHQSGALWIYANRGAVSPTFEAARVLELPPLTEFVRPADLDGDGLVDLVGASSGTRPFSFLTNESMLDAYNFTVSEAKISDVATRSLASFATPSGLAFVDLDGVPPEEIVVTSRDEYSTAGEQGVRVLFGL